MKEGMDQVRPLQVAETEWRELSTVKLDWSSLALKIRHENADKARKRSEIDRVLWEEDDIIVRYPWQEFRDFPFSDRNPAMLNPVADKSKFEIVIVDKALVKSVEKKYEDRWEPCNGMCGDPGHMEYQPHEIADGFIWDNNTLSKTIKAGKLSQAVKAGEKALEKIRRAVREEV